MSFKQPYHMSPTQLALQAERKMKKATPKPQPVAAAASPKLIIERPWIPLSYPATERNVRVLTFNLLAQTLVRRKLFPTSGDSLKEKDRFPMIQHELLADPDVSIMTLQEVDRMQKLAPSLQDAGFDYVYSSGAGKQHGCAIVFKQAQFSPIANKTVVYDDEDVGSERKTGLSFKTRNIALLLALKASSGQSVIVATTHLFWHPSYTYERARQALILLREVTRFRSELKVEWPCIIAGDFNFAPDDAAYSLLLGRPLSAAQKASLAMSRVVHRSLDPSVPATSSSMIDEEGADDPDRVITNARRATPEDGLLSDEELTSLAGQVGNVRSAYDEGMRTAAIPDVQLFKDRYPIFSHELGGFEPCYTAYAHFWKTTLDYVFLKDDSPAPAKVTGLLGLHRSRDLEPGLPQKGVGGSDHYSLCAELSW